MFTKYPSLTSRLKDRTRELCRTEGDTTMFQVRSLKSLKGQNDWERKMKRMNWKTLAVGGACDEKIHSKQSRD